VKNAALYFLVVTQKARNRCISVGLGYPYTATLERRRPLRESFIIPEESRAEGSGPNKVTENRG
jgi:hypothetical protein